MFLGHFELDAAASGHIFIPVRCTNTSEVLSNPDSDPTYRIYDQTGTLMTSGTGTLSQTDSDAVENVTDDGGGNVRITLTAHTFQNGDRVTVANVGGATGANGTHTVEDSAANSIDLAGSTFGGTYTSGGTVNITGLYSATHSPASASGYARGGTYLVIIDYAVSSNSKSEYHTFEVV